MATDKILAVFKRLDRNHDNQLSQKEVDEAVIDLSLDPSFAELVASIKAEFQGIAELHKDGWFGRKKNITLADILIFEHILQEQPVNPGDSQTDVILSLKREKGGSTKKESLAVIALGIMERVRSLSKKKRCLYSIEDDPAGSIKPDAIRQGMVGDCFFLAALISVVATNPQIVPRIIRKNKDNTYTITFPGLREEPIIIEAPTLVELALYASPTDWGIWPAVLEKAYGQYQGRFMKRPHLVAAENTHAAESMSDAIQLLTGQAGKSIFLSKLSLSDITTILTDCFREKRAVGAASKPSKTDFTEDAKLPSSHAYSVIAWNPDELLITLRNPWGPGEKSGPELEDGEPEDRLFGNVFVLDLPKFLRNFDFLYCEEWLADDRFIDSPQFPSGAIIKNIGHRE